MNLTDIGRRHAYLVNELAQRQACNQMATILVVEGRDDKAALQEFRSEHCRIHAAGGREKVIEIVGLMAREKNLRKGFLGLVDRDFERFSNEISKPTPRRVCEIPDFNDIECALLFYRADRVLSKLVKDEELANLDWIRAHADLLPLERLVRHLVAPIGALRIARQTSGERRSIDQHENETHRPDPRQNLVYKVWNGASPDAEISFDCLKEVVSGIVSNAMAHAICKRAQELLDLNPESKRWDLIRGKDLTAAIAIALSSARHALNFPGGSPVDILERVQCAIPFAFDADLLTECGIAKSLQDAISQEERLDAYLRLNL